MSGESMFACLAPTGTHWGLGRTEGESGLTLIGWKLSTEPVDAGMPGVIADVFAAAMTRMGHVIFPSSELYPEAKAEWTAHGGDSARAMSFGISARLRSGRRNTLVATRDAQTVKRLFDDGGFPWWMGTQFALVGSAEEALAAIDRSSVEALLEPEWVRAARELSKKGIMGVLRSGVDGDVAGLLTLDPAREPAMLTVIEQVARSFGVGWTIVEEASFGSMLAPV